MAEESRTQEERPGVDLAYDLMQSSYDLAVSRLNAVENRIQAVMVFSAGFLFAAPALVATSGTDITLNSALFFIAGALALLNLVIGTFTRARGEIKLRRIYANATEWLDLPEYWFKYYAVEDAEEHFKENIETVNYKGKVALFMTGLFILETVFLIVWGYSQVS